MSFTPKTWHDEPSRLTPIDGTAVADLEVRVTDYADSVTLQVADRADGAQPVWSSASGQMVAAKRTFRVVTERPYNADKTGATDTTAAILSALSGGATGWLEDGSYTVDNLQPLSGSKLQGTRGAKLLAKAGSTGQVVLIGDATSNVTLEGFEVDSTAAGTGALGVQVGGTKNTVQGLYLHDLKSYGIYVRDGASWITVKGNHVQRHYLHGITCGGASAVTGPTHIDIVENRVEDGLDDDASALGIVGIASHVIFRGNHTRNSGHDGISAYNPENRNITAIGNQVEDPQGSGHGIHVAGQHVVIVGNQFRKVNGYAIFLSASPNPPSTPTACFDATVEGNTVDVTEVAAAGAGIYIINYTDVTIGPNHIKGANGHGMHLEGCVGVDITGGSYLNSVLGSGLRIYGSSKVTIMGGRYSGNHEDGITILDKGATLSTDVTIVKPEICGNGGKGINAVNNAAGNRFEVTPGTMRSNTGGNIGALSTTSKVGTGMVDDSDTLASAATLTPPYGHDTFFVTGGVACTGIGSGARAKHRRVTFIAVAGFTLTNGSNLALGANIVIPAGQAATLDCADGANWYPVA